MNETLSIILNFLLASGLVGTLFFYNSKKRKAEAEAEKVEITNEQTEVDRLEERLKARDDKIDTLYIDYRKVQLDYVELLKKHNAVELEYREAVIKRCDVRSCANRVPPSEY